MKRVLRYKADKITHCPKGHEYTEKNTYIYKQKNKRCKKCRCIAVKKNYIKKPRILGGVSFHGDRTKKPWAARITLNKKRKSLGYFRTLEEAQNAVNEMRVVTSDQKS